MNLSLQCQPGESEEPDDLDYIRVYFSKSQTDPVYANVRSTGLRSHKEEKEEEDDGVEYTLVKPASSAPR